MAAIWASCTLSSSTSLQSAPFTKICDSSLECINGYLTWIVQTVLAISNVPPYKFVFNVLIIITTTTTTTAFDLNYTKCELHTMFKWTEEFISSSRTIGKSSLSISDDHDIGVAIHSATDCVLWLRWLLGISRSLHVNRMSSSFVYRINLVRFLPRDVYG